MLLRMLVFMSLWRIQSSNTKRAKLLVPFFYQRNCEANKCTAPPSAHVKTICLHLSCLCCVWVVQKSLFTSIFSNSPLKEPPTSLPLLSICWIYHPHTVFPRVIFASHIVFRGVTHYSILEATYNLSIFKRHIIFNSKFLLLIFSSGWNFYLVQSALGIWKYGL